MFELHAQILENLYYLGKCAENSTGQQNSNLGDPLRTAKNALRTYSDGKFPFNCDRGNCVRHRSALRTCDVCVYTRINATSRRWLPRYRSHAKITS